MQSEPTKPENEYTLRTLGERLTPQEMQHMAGGFEPPPESPPAPPESAGGASR
ncbi:MAG: hypothetical protein ACPGUV_06185 [Polyangiales bacterium]